MLKLILSCAMMLFMATPSFSAPAYVPVKENVVDSFFQMSHYKKMVLDLCSKADITDAGFCKKTSSSKRIIIFPPTKRKNIYRADEVDVQVAVGKGIYVNHDLWAEKPDRKEGERRYQIVGARDVEFEYVNDGQDLYLKFHHVKGEDDVDDPETMIFFGLRALMATSQDDDDKYDMAFTLIPEIETSFVTNDVFGRYFKSHPNAKRIVVAKCTGPEHNKCSKVDKDTRVIDKDLLAKATHRKVTPVEHNHLDLDKSFRVYDDTERGYSVAVSGTDVTFFKKLESKDPNLEEYESFSVEALSGGYGFSDLGFTPNNEWVDDEDGGRSVKKSRFTFYKFSME